jgi:hypothetical protein
LSDVNANISINFDTGQALASLRQLQAGLSRFNQSLTQGNVAAANAQKGLNDQLMQAINATGKFVATQKDIATSTSSFTQALEKNQLSMREYFRYTAAAATANTKVFKGMFAQEREIINRARKDRVKSLQAQYTQLSDAQGQFVKTLQVVPKHLQMVNGQYTDYATRMQMAAQRQQFLNQLLKQGSTQLLNFGKNTQWAGRQLMVGLTIPLTILGSTAAKSFMEMEQAVLKFERVYGDMITSMGDTDKAVADVKALAKEFTKYGISVVDTMNMAASAAAMGLTGNALTAQITNATNLAVLGQVEQQQALETTISLTNAFGIATEDLAAKINFLNAVENQTVLSIEDLTIAIPKAGPVVKQLGGSVEDLAFFMTAMKEGGINASEGANALKSGLASMINPSKKSAEFLAQLGINIKGIVEANAGDLKGTVVGFSRALDTLDPLNRARAIEQLFGKFQFARLSTLFQNVTKDGSQASRAFGLAGKSVQELAILSERELGKVEDATGVKFKKSIENLKNELVPVGKAFLQAATPIVEFVGRVLEKFNNLSDGTKKTIAVVVGVVGGLAPILLMTFGVLMNGVANGIKLFAMLRNGIAKLNGQNNVLGGGFDYMTQQQIELAAQTNALHTSHSQLISTFNVEKSAVDALALAYGNAASQARALAASSPGLFNAVPGPAGAVSGLPKKPLGFAQGGVVPGRGDKDTVPAMLTPGEVVLTKDTVKNNPELVAALQNNAVKRYNGGTGGGSKDISARLTEKFRGVSAPGSEDFQGRMKTLIDGAMSQTDKGVERVIKFAAASGVEITAEQTDQIEFYRKEMLKAVEQAGDALVHAIDLSADQIKKRLKEMSPIEGTQARKSVNVFDLIDKHGNQPQSETFGHLTAGKTMSSSQTKERLEPGSKVSTEVDAIDKAATYLNNLPKSDPRKPKKPIVPDYNLVSGLGIDGMTQETNTLLKLGTKNTQEFLKELNNVGPLEAWDTLMKQNGLTVEENGREIEILHAKFKAFVADLATKKSEISDTDVTGFITGLDSDTEISPRMKNAVKRSENTITAARLSGVTSADAKNIEDVIRSGEVGVPGLQDRAKFKIAKSGSAQGGESASNRVNGIGFYDAQVEEALAAEAETLSPPKVKATEEDKAKAEAAGKEVGEAALRGVRKGATTESPSREGKEVGKDIADGIIIGMQESQPAVESQSARLGDSAVPKRQRTAAETQAQVDKMDLENKAFYDDIDTPEMRDERQILKSQDRQRRKLGAVRQVGDAMPETAAPSQTAQLTVASSKQTADASAQLATKTKEAVTAQSQVVQQIKDESRSRVTVKGNTVNIGKAREKADKAENEAAIAKARAHALEAEQAKQKKSNSPTTITDEQVLAAKEKANAAELEYAKIREELAEQGISAAPSEEVKDTAKTTKKVEKAKEVVANGTQEQGDLLRKTVEGSEDVADSTVLVAEQTEELAGVTGQAIDAQTSNTTNLITGSQLTSATSQNLGEVLQATDQTGIAQQDLAESSGNIADINEQIEEQKRIELARLKKHNADQAALNGTPPLGPVPPGNQSSGPGFVNPETALGSVEAYEEASTYTRNKNGQVLFDPETNQPTTMTQSQITKKKRGMRREKVGKYSGKAAGALGTATMVAGMVGAPPQVTAALGTAATLAQFAPMLAGLGPAGWVAAGVVAVGASVYLFNKHLSDSAKAAAKFALSTKATTDKMASVGKATGKVGSSELVARKNQNLFQEYNEVGREGRQFGNKFLKQQVGKDMQKSVKANMAKNGNKIAAEDFARELSYYVSDGLMSGEEANSVAEQIGVNLKNTTFGLDIKANIISMIGADGNDLYKDPVQARVDLVNTSLFKAEELVQDITTYTSASGTKYKSNVSGTDAATIQATDSNAVDLAQAQADAIQRIYEDKKRVLELELASTTNAEKKLKIEEDIKALGIQNKTDMDTMNTNVGFAIAKAEQHFRENIYSGKLISFRESGAFDASRDKVTTAYEKTGSKEAAQTFLDRSKNFNSMQGFMGDSKEAQTFQYKMEMMVGNKIMSPEQANSMLDLFEGSLPELNAALTLGIKQHGAAKTFKVLEMFGGFTDKTMGKKFVANLIRKDPEQFDEIARTIASLQALSGEEIDIEVVLTSIGVEGLELMNTRLAEIEKWPEDKEISVKTITEFAEENNINSPELQAMMKEKWFTDMKPGEQKEVIQKYTQLHMAYASRSPEAIQALAEEKAKLDLYKKYGTTDGSGVHKLEFEEYTTKYVTELTNTNSQAAEGTTAYFKKDNLPPGVVPPGTGVDTGPKERDTTYDDLLKRLRNVRNAAINAAGGVKELNKALLASGSKAVQNRFQGISQQLRGKGTNEQFIQYLMGLDTPDLKKFGFTATKKGKQTYTEKVAKRDKEGNIVKDKKGKTVMVNKTQSYKAGDFVLTDKGNQLKRGYDKAIIGEFNEAQAVTLRNLNDQEKVQRKLIGLGYDQGSIQRILSDEYAVQIIASGKLTSKELETNALLAKQTTIREKINGLINSGKEAIQSAANIKLAPKVQEFFTKMKEQGINLSPGAMKDLLTDPSQLDGAIAAMEDYESGAAGARDRLKEIVDGLNAIKANSNIQIALEYVQKNTAGRVQAGYEAAQKVMSARTLAYSNMTVGELKGVKVTNSRTGVTTNAGETGYNNALKNKLGGVEDPSIAGKTLAGVQKERATLAQRSAVASAASALSSAQLAAAEDVLSKLQEGLSNTLNSINKKYDDIIKGQQKSLEALNKRLNDEFDKKIKAKQERTTMLSNDLTVMDKQAESINEKYDKQVTALQEIQKVQEAITQQQQQQLGLADALTQGDLAAAARAAQEMRASNAAQYGGGQLEALDLSRKNELDSLKGPESGLTRKEIAEEQYQIQQEIYKLETSPERKKILEDIEKITEAIAKNEELRTKELEDAEKSVKAQVEAQEAVVKSLKAAADAQTLITSQLALQDAELAKQEANLQAIVDSVVEVDDFTGYTLEDWKTLAEKTLDVDALMESIAIAMAAAADESAAMANSWQDILDIINALPESVTTKQIIETINYVKTINVPSDQDPGTYKDPEDTPEDKDNLAELELAAKELDAAEAAMIAAQNAWDDAVNQGKASLFQGLHIALTNSKNRFAAAQEKYNAIVAKQNTGNGGSSGGSGGGGGSTHMQMLASGGMVNPMKFAMGGFASGSDTVPAMLTPGEFIMSKYAVQSYGIDKMKAINNGTALSGDSVYNYSVNVAVQSDANADEIARAVMRQIRQVDSQRITGNRN